MTGQSPITSPFHALDIVQLGGLIPASKPTYLIPAGFRRAGGTFFIGVRSMAKRFRRRPAGTAVRGRERVWIG
jgi:hypothetical protein